MVDVLHPWLVRFAGPVEGRSVVIWTEAGQLSALLELLHDYRDGGVVVFEGLAGLGKVDEPAAPWEIRRSAHVEPLRSAPKPIEWCLCGHSRAVHEGVKRELEGCALCRCKEFTR